MPRRVEPRRGQYDPAMWCEPILAALAGAKEMTRRQIGEAIGANQAYLLPAINDLLKAGKITRKHYPARDHYTYALAPGAVAAQKPRRRVSTWTGPAVFPGSPRPVVSLPLEPWADTVPQDAPQGAPWRPHRPASGAGATSGHPDPAKAVSGPRLEGR